MGQKRGDEAIPDGAYSRVTRDLAQVTAAFKEHMRGLPDRMTRSYDCLVRELTASERERLDGTRIELDRAYAVDPGDPECAVLLVGERTFEGGYGVLLAVGRGVRIVAPDCFCDACDEDSDGLIAHTDEIIALAPSGFHEFRRPYVPDEDEDPLFDPPWLEEGYVTPGGDLDAHAGHNVSGEPFSVNWKPWAKRPASTT